MVVVTISKNMTVPRSFLIFISLNIVFSINSSYFFLGFMLDLWFFIILMLILLLIIILIIILLFFLRVFIRLLIHLMLI